MPQFRLFVRSVNLASEVDLRRYEEELCAELSAGFELFGQPVIVAESRGSPCHVRITRDLVKPDDDDAHQKPADWG